MNYIKSNRPQSNIQMPKQSFGFQSTSNLARSHKIFHKNHFIIKKIHEFQGESIGSLITLGSSISLQLHKI